MSKIFVRLVTVAAAVGMLLTMPPVASAQKQGKPETGAGTSTSARKFLEGSWSLMSFQVFPPDKPPIEVGGQGHLEYDGFGNMTVEIRVPPNAVDPLRFAGVPTNDGLMSMKGRTAIDMQQHTLTYFLENQKPFGTPDGPLAFNRKRYWEVDGNVLTLTTKSDAGKPLSIAKWQKMAQ